jgi:hypothetical protein
VYVNQVLIPELPASRTIIWDQLSSHLNAGIVGLLEAAGHRVFSSAFVPRACEPTNAAPFGTRIARKMLTHFSDTALRPIVWHIQQLQHDFYTQF